MGGGHSSTFIPIEFQELDSMKISKICCGNYHCIAITSTPEEKVITWGSSPSVKSFFSISIFFFYLFIFIYFLKKF